MMGMKDVMNQPEKIHITLTESSVFINGARVQLKDKEREIFNMIARHPQGMVTTGTLMRDVNAADKKELQRFVRDVRKKFRQYAAQEVIISVTDGPGKPILGYAFNADLTVKR